MTNDINNQTPQNDNPLITEVEALKAQNKRDVAVITALTTRVNQLGKENDALHEVDKRHRGVVNKLLAERDALVEQIKALKKGT